MDLRELRKTKGLTQSKLAKKIGVSVQSYQKWEDGTSKPKEENQKKLDEILKK